MISPSANKNLLIISMEDKVLWKNSEKEIAVKKKKSYYKLAATLIIPIKYESFIKKSDCKWYTCIHR